MQSGKEMNYWPGFVDALSNVVLTMVFVVVIFTFALTYLASKVAVKQAEKICEASSREAAPETPTPDKVQASIDAALVAKLMRENEQLKQRLAQQSSSLAGSPGQADTSANRSRLDQRVEVKVQGDTKVKNSGQVNVTRQGQMIVIGFPTGVVEINADTLKALDTALAPYAAELNTMRIELDSIMGSEIYSQAKRFAYFRAVGVRNYFVEKGVAPQSITSKISESVNPGPDSGQVVIRLVKN